MFWILGLVSIPLTYIYRSKVYSVACSVAYNTSIYCIKWYLYFKNKKANSITNKKSIELDKDVYIHKYYCNINKELFIISSEEYHTIDKNIIYDLRNNIVHCSLQNEVDIILDLTGVFRKFIYHFDKETDESKLRHFFKYLEYKYKLKDNIDDLYFVIFKNDDDFTEIKEKVKDINDKYYKNVI